LDIEMELDFEREHEGLRLLQTIWFIWALKINEDSFGQKREREGYEFGVSLGFNIRVCAVYVCVIG